METSYHSQERNNEAASTEVCIPNVDYLFYLFTFLFVFMGHNIMYNVRCFNLSHMSSVRS